MFKLNARAIKSIIVVMGITFLSGCNNEVMNCLAKTQATSCLELAVKDVSLNATPSNKIDQGGAPTSGGKIDQGGSPSSGGKIDQGGAPASGGKISNNNTSSGSNRRSTQRY